MMLLFFSLFAVVISTIHFVKATQNFKGNYYLASFFLINALWGIVVYGTHYAQSSVFGAVVYGHFTPIIFLTGPFLYFYIRSVIRDEFALRPKDYLHFLPFVIFVFALIPYAQIDFDQKVKLIDVVRGLPNHPVEALTQLVPHTVSILFRPLFYLFYLILSAKMILSREQEMKNNKLVKDDYYKYFIIWINILMSALSLITGMFIFLNFLYLFVDNLQQSEYINIVEIIIIFIFALLNLSFLFIPSLMLGLPQYKSEKVKVAPVENAERVAAEVVTPEINLLSNEHVQQIHVEIKKFLEEKPYIQANFSKVTLSAATGIPLHHLSYYFTHIMEKSFVDWRNELRIEFAISMIKDGKAKLLTMDTIARESGFSNQTTFISSFKRYTGTTPYNFLKGKQF